jgi:hypothetical protein
VLENRVLGRIPYLRREEVTGGRRRFHNLYSSPKANRMFKHETRRVGMWHAWGKWKLNTSLLLETLRGENT